jgi:hypothetical protein
VKCFRNIVAILSLVLTMPLARACAVISSAAMAHRECCKQKADTCCDVPSQVCCATQAPANTYLFPSQVVPQLLLPARTVQVVHTDRIDSLIVQHAATHLPAEHSPPGLLIVATTFLRI